MTAGSPKAGSRTSSPPAGRPGPTASREGPAERQARSTAHPGTRLPVDVRHRMEPVVGGDLTDVMIRHGSTAGALATTEGRDVTFATGLYRPGTPIGEAVLAHELAHTRQQSGPAAGAVASDALERQADQAGYLAAMRLLDPAAAAGLTRPAISEGQGLQLQRCSPPTYGEIKDLPTREEYERRGELQPRGFPALTSLGPNVFIGFPVGSLDLQGVPPGRLTPAPPPPPVDVEAAAPVLEYEQLVARLDILEARQDRIAATIPDLDQGLRSIGPGGLQFPSVFGGGNVVLARLGLQRPGGPPPAEPFILRMPGTTEPTPEQTVPRDPVLLSRRIASADVVQLRALEALAALQANRADQERANSQLAGYDLTGALGAIDEVRRDYRDAAEKILTAEALPALRTADERNAALPRVLTQFKLTYYQRRWSKYPQIQGSISDINDWAMSLQGDLDQLTERAKAVEQARLAGDPRLPSLEASFDQDAQLLAASIEALGEWDSAVQAFEYLKGNSALWGYEGVDRIAARLGQLRQAATDKDLPYLEVLLRDHRADSAVQEFYRVLPSIVMWSHLIIGLAIMLIAAVVTAGVGLAISAAGSAAATAIAGSAAAVQTSTAAGVVLNATWVIKLGAEALVFTAISRELSALFPGMEPKGSFWGEFLWNLGMFGVMHGASKLAKGLIEAFAINRAAGKFVLEQATAFVALEAFGYVRFAVEEGRTMTLSEFGMMSAQNLVMMTAMTATMTPLKPVMTRLERNLTSAFSRFSAKYRAQAAELAARRTALELEVRERMKANPEATAEEVADLKEQARQLDADLNRLVEDVRSDPSIDLRQLGDEVTGVLAQARETTLVELLPGMEASVGLQPTGESTSWSFAAGKGGELTGYLDRGGYVKTSERVVGSGKTVIEVELPGKGRVTFVERVTETPVAQTAGGEPVPEATVPARVKWLQEVSGRLAKARGGAAERPEATKGAEPPAAEPKGAEPTAAETVAEATAAEVAHARAIELAMQDGRAEAGLRRLANTFPPRYKTALARVIAAVPPENMGSFLRAVGDPAMGGQPVAFYQALGRNAAACRLVETYGGQVLLDVVGLQRGTTQAVRMARSRADVDRVLKALDKAATEPGTGTGTTGADVLINKIRTSRGRTFRSLDKLVGPRERPGVQIEPDLTDPSWREYQRQANEYAKDHPPEGGALNTEERQLRAALFQTVERARAGEYSELLPPERQQLLEDFDTVADAARLDSGWRSAKRGQLWEALALGRGQPSEPTRWLNRKIVKGSGKSGYTIPDEAIPRVRPEEIADGSVMTKPRTWVERKDYNLTSGDVDAAGVNKVAKATATRHLAEARADLENYPLGSTIVIEYARDPGRANAEAMAAILLAEPRIVRVVIAGKPFTR
ncbi:eCIS core domain-containing protein [Kribbella sp. NPDC002412]